MAPIEKAISFKIQKSGLEAVMSQHFIGPHFYSHLHYHPEFQITAICKGEGILYAGNNMVGFRPGDAILIGSNVPHLLKNSQVYFSENSPGVEEVSLFFDLNSLGPTFFDMAEMRQTRTLLTLASRVIRVIDNHKARIHHQIIETAFSKNEERITNFLLLLKSLVEVDKEFVNPESYGSQIIEEEDDRLGEVISYIFQHFSEELSIADIASVANFSRSHFSAFFKQHTGKSFVEFLNGVRVEHACQQLISSRKSVEQICYESGFRNLANFIRQFRQVKGVSPSQYRKAWIVG